MYRRITLIGVSLFCASALGELKVVTTVPDLAWAAQKIGGKHVVSKALLTGTENPHYVDTIPDYISQVAEADVVCVVGLELEVGWMPKIFNRAGNSKVNPGGKGYCDGSKSVELADKITGAVDRSMGDLHPLGNPHYWLSPKGLAEASLQLRDVLVRNDPTHLVDYNKNYDALKKEMDALVAESRAKLQPVLSKLQTPGVIEYHREFSYFFKLYDIASLGAIEEKPGVPPSSGRLADIGLSAKQAQVKVAVAATYAPEKLLRRFNEISGVPLFVTPTSTATDYPKLHRQIVDKLVKALSEPTKDLAGKKDE